MKKKTLRLRAFTLIELLVVITIIGILASLAIPTIGAALDKANQTKDLNNIKQLGTIMFMDANDSNGAFNTNVALDAYKELYNNGTGVLSTLSVLGGTGQTPPTIAADITASHVAWGYNAGLTTSAQPGTVLLLSYGSGMPASGTNQTTTLSTNALWKNKGVLAYYVGGNAKFIKAKTNSVTILESTNVTSASPGGFADPQ